MPEPASAPAATRVVRLAGEIDLAGFRSAARALVQAGVPPDMLQWTVAGAAAPGLFEDADAADAADDARPAQTAPAPRVPADFAALRESVVQHADPTRFQRLYRLLWRLQHEPGLRHDPLDAEMAEARRMAQAVRREQHKMKAFLRFREVSTGDGEAPLHVAWFEPAHHVVEATAPFFMRRFAGMRFAILTPLRSVRWDGQALAFGPAASRQDAPPADAGEALWLTYYASIFNPARLKLRAMEKEMPRRYWPQLPEARLISGLAAQAQERSARMIAAPPTHTTRRLPGRPFASPAAGGDPAHRGESPTQPESGNGR